MKRCRYSPTQWRRYVTDQRRRQQHGTSGDPGHRYTLDDCAIAAGEILAALGIDGPVDWVGNAWGGHVGIVFAAMRPERCRTLVTLGTPVQAYTRSERRLFQVLLAVYRVAGMIGYLSSGISEALLSPRTRANDPEAVALVLGSLRGLGRRPFTNAMRSISLGRPDLTPRLGAVRCPTLFVTGSEHEGWSPEQAEAKSKLLADGSVVVVPDTAYLTPLEAPAESVRLIRAHWAQAAG